MIRFTAMFMGTILLMFTLPAWAEDDGFTGLSFFYPLVTRRPVVERELELKVRHEKGRDGRLTETTAAIEWPVLPRWQVELEVPLIFNDPRDGASTAGIGDLRLENKVIVLSSLEHKTQVAVGLEARFPSGSERRRLGGEAAVEPFVTGGIGLGDFDVLLDLAWEFNVNAHVKGPQEQELGAGVAVAYLLHRLFTPLVELRTTTRTRTAGDDELRHRTRVTILPGFNTRPWPGTTLRFGVELPLTSARSFDYTLHGAAVWEF
jgi:hypothetical protein